jgi:site-specific recombinase XerD
MNMRSPAEKWLAEYDAHLDQVVGLALSTRKIYRPFARRFITTCFGSAAPDWSALTASMITAFVTQEAAARQGPDRQKPAVVVRSFLRFLIFRGEIMPGLETAAPIPPRWRHAALPSHLSPEEVDRVLATHQDGRGLSLRNRAMILLLARLGLRAQEVVALCLDDIDWTEGWLHIRPGKTHQARSLPLPQEVGQALVAYLRDDRPQRDHRQVFLQCRPPFQPLTRSAVWAIVQQAFQHAGIAPRPRRGSHIFRHTLASRLVNQGATFKDVADILGHRSLQTTGIYAKLDLQALQAVALPWLGGAPCKAMS